MADLKLKNITKIYAGGVAAVKSLTMDIPDKEFVVLVGPSGCGKSTLLRMIAGLEDISDGELYINGFLVNKIHPKDRDIAMVFQNYALYPFMTVFDNMAFGLKLRRVQFMEIEERVTEAAEILGLDKLLDRYPANMSGGQRQRVALGRSLSRKPKVFLLDEPLSNLDAKMRVQMRTEIVKLHKKLGTTFIYVTHDQTEAMAMGTLIVVMKDGVVQQAAPPARLYDYPANKFVAQFLGMPPMNMFEAELLRDSGGMRLKLLGKDIEIGDGFALPESGTRVFAGIRPESFETAEKSGGLCFDATAEITENLGGEIIVYARIDGNGGELTAVRLPKDVRIEKGAAFKLAPKIKQLHLFDAATEKTLRKI